MQKLEKLSVLILAYNRFDKFKRCIETLSKQGIKKIFLSIDGPKNKNDLKNQKKIKMFCKNNEYGMKIIINQLDNNYGCRLGPLKGISWFFSKNQYGIILEDDVTLSKKCIEAFSYLLEKYSNNEEFLSITSFNELTNNKIESLYAMPIWRSGGWASWAHKWESHINFSNKIKSLNMWDLYKLLPKHFRSITTVKLVKASQLNFIDAWDYEFNFSHIVHKKNSLTLGSINCSVYGFDDTATHTVDIESIGIDFNLYRERIINTKRIIKLEIISCIPVLKKCGFHFKKNKFIFDTICDFNKSLLFSFVFWLRKIKRIIYKRY